MDIIKCILKIYPDWKGVVWGNAYDGIKPHELETRPIPLLADLQAIWDKTVKEKNRIDEIRKQRAKDYMSIQDQLDMIYHDKVNGTNKWVEYITGIKIKHPIV